MEDVVGGTRWDVTKKFQEWSKPGVRRVTGCDHLWLCENIRLNLNFSLQIYGLLEIYAINPTVLNWTKTLSFSKSDFLSGSSWHSYENFLKSTKNIEFCIPWLQKHNLPIPGNYMKRKRNLLVFYLLELLIRCMSTSSHKHSWDLGMCLLIYAHNYLYYHLQNWRYIAQSKNVTCAVDYYM